jgi:hypothetical protein
MSAPEFIVEFDAQEGQLVQARFRFLGRCGTSCHPGRLGHFAQRRLGRPARPECHRGGIKHAAGR